MPCRRFSLRAFANVGVDTNRVPPRVNFGAGRVRAEGLPVPASFGEERVTRAGTRPATSSDVFWRRRSSMKHSPWDTNVGESLSGALSRWRARRQRLFPPVFAARLSPSSAFSAIFGDNRNV